MSVFFTLVWWLSLRWANWLETQIYQQFSKKCIWIWNLKIFVFFIFPGHSLKRRRRFNHHNRYESMAFYRPTKHNSLFFTSSTNQMGERRYLIKNSDGSGIRNVVFGSVMEKWAFKGKLSLNKTFLHFMSNSWHIRWFFKVECTEGPAKLWKIIK